MDVQRRNAIAYSVLKLVIKEETRLSHIPELRRKAGNLSKQTGIPVEEIVAFGKDIVRDVFEEQMAAVDRKRED